MLSGTLLRYFRCQIYSVISQRRAHLSLSVFLPVGLLGFFFCCCSEAILERKPKEAGYEVIYFSEIGG